MKRLVFILTLVLAFSAKMNAQNFTFIGENSYPSTERFELQSNSDKEEISNLNLVFAKDGISPMIIVSSKLTDVVKIANKLIIYLDDGTVISCTDRGINDNVDDVATSAYRLTPSEISKMKKSNINTVRYEIVCPICGVFNIWEGVYSASNKESSKTDFTEVVEQFFEEIRICLENNEQVKLSGFGNFDLRDKGTRPGRNPKTGEEVPISARRVVTFKPGQKLRARVEKMQGDA